MTAPRDARSRKAGARRGAPEPPDGDLVALVRQLGAVLAELGLSEVEVTREGLSVRVQRTPAVASAPLAAPNATAPPTPTPGTTTDVASSVLVTVEAPMVGTFYRASSPTADPYVREGDVVKHGQILCIIEAMKLMNEVESKVSGRVVRALVENAQPVEYGQPLFLIDPT
jgi:acetyl-CoA carboxylase biotin carboxyl carrier protein